ncbi:MAG: 4-alpha-glucanotransferase, partial [Frankiales bacterium]|nr:4-alpha-glucanotransferase [Frankiales bacterium]
MTSPPAPADPLARLAAAHGVATSYEDWAGTPVPVSPDAVVSALAALGVEAGSDDAVAVALQEVQDAPWRRLLPPSLVVRGPGGTVEVRAPEDADVVLTVLLEDGSEVDLEAGAPAERRSGRVLRTAALPELPLGWHRLRAAAGDETDEAVLVVAPERIESREGRSWGWMVQLYSLRSAQSWGLGDYGDLRTVVASTAADGAGVVLLNPLHAETPVLPLNPSPYSPSSRRFRSALYLRVQDVPEHAAAPAELQAQVAALRPESDPDRIARDPAFTAKLAALELLWPHHREDALAAFRAERGQELEDVALFFALAEVHGTPWQEWPEDLRRPDAPGIEAAREAHADRVGFWCWVQLLVDEQLAAVTEAAGPMAVGVVHDLAVGVDAGGADAWALQDSLALGTTVGAPPDSFNQQGQDWGLPPWRPDRLREQGYAPYRSLVQGVLRHAGGLRIDHVMGLFRLWWVPQGRSAAEGTYVSYDADAMLGVLALEAVRAGVVVVGEDLGTVEDRVRTSLERTGVLGSAVLWFETDEDTGSPLPPSQWREAALATVTTHDLPTAAGFLAEEHVRVRDELGQLGVPVEQERARARAEREALLAMLEAEG